MDSDSDESFTLPMVRAGGPWRAHGESERGLQAARVFSADSNTFANVLGEHIVTGCLDTSGEVQPNQLDDGIALCAACSASDISAVRHVLAGGKGGATSAGLFHAVLVKACNNGRLEVVQELLHHTAEHLLPATLAPLPCDRALSDACFRGHVAIAQLLLQLEPPHRATADACAGAFVQACKADRVDVARLLLAQDAERCNAIRKLESDALSAAFAAASDGVLKLLLPVSTMFLPDVHVEYNLLTVTSEAQAAAVQPEAQAAAVQPEAQAAAVQPEAQAVAVPPEAQARKSTESHIATLHRVLWWAPCDPIPADADTNLMFMLACRFGLTHLAKALLALRGAQRVDVHADENWALAAAVLYGHVDIVRLFPVPFRVEHANFIICPEFVTMACKVGHAAVLPVAAEYCVDFEDELNSLFADLLVTACEEDNIEGVRVLLQHMSAQQWRLPHAFHKTWRELCKDGEAAVVKQLLAQRGSMALDIAALDKRYTIEPPLPMDDEECVLDYVDETPDRGTGLSLACLVGHTAVVRELLAAEAHHCVDVHAEDDLALRRAVRGQSHGAIRLLLQHPGAEWHHRMPLLAKCLRLLPTERQMDAKLALYSAATYPLPLQYIVGTAALFFQGLHVARTLQRPAEDAAPMVSSPVACLVVQHILVWVLQQYIKRKNVQATMNVWAPGHRGMHRGSEQRAAELLYFDVFALCTALPAARRSPEVTPLLQHAVMRTAAYQRLQWCGVRVPVGDIRGGADGVRLCGLLQRRGRRCMLLHRAALRSAMFSARQSKQRCI